MKLNNHGQTLVLFILLLPILLMLTYMVIELGLDSVSKRKTDNVVKYAVSYGVKNIDKENIKEETENIIKTNLNNIDKLKVEVTDNVSVEIEVKFDNLFSNMFKNKINSYSVIYIGYTENDKIKIVRG